MKKTWLAVIGLVLILGVVGFTGCTDGVNGTLELKGNLTSQQEGIWVSGEGKVTAVPDIASLNLGVEAQAASVADAQAQVSQAMADLMDALKDQGVDEKDIQTQYYNVYQVTRWIGDEQKEEVIGYRVTNTVTAKVREVEKAGEVIDAVIAAGGDLVRINNIAFNIDDPKPYYEDARELAVAYAREKGEQLASEAGVTLGKITYITESNYTPGPIYRNYASDYAEAVPAAAPATSISAGELEITTTVQIVYAID
ncbi:MAG: SIMPL domain-containing protein [Dehalococcoidales bacterium]|nr:SIMPL domain-containing protein [Dehalococcoidales bacterium]